jgi:hypothetical protein
MRDKAADFGFNFVVAQIHSIHNKITKKIDKDFFLTDDYLMGYIMGISGTALSIFLQRELESEQDSSDRIHIFARLLAQLSFADERLDEKYEKRFFELMLQLDNRKGFVWAGYVDGEKDLLTFFKEQNYNQTLLQYLMRIM